MDHLNYKNYLLDIFKKKIILFNKIGIVFLLVTLLQALTPFVLRVVIDLGINKNNVSFINMIFFGYFILIISIGFGNFIKSYLSNLLSSDFKSTIIFDYLENFLNKKNIISNLNYGQFYNKIKDLEFLSSFLTKNFIYFINSVIMTVVYLLILLLFNSTVFFIFFIYIIISFVWEFFFIAYKKLLESKIRENKIIENNYWVDLLNSFYDIKLYCKEKSFLNIWKSNDNSSELSLSKDLFTKNCHEFGTHIINGLKNISILYVCSFYVLEGSMSIGTLISIQFIIGFMNSPVIAIINFVSSSSSYKLSIESINNDYKLIKSNFIEDEIIIDNKINSIRFYKVNFAYPNSKNLCLKNINFNLNSGKKYAIVGKSGCGKSSILKLLLGISSPYSGKINVNNISTTELDLTSYRNHFSSVLQESKLLKGSFLYNIVFFEDNINYELLDKVIEITQLNDILSIYPRGIFDEIDNESKGLSEGQKQRILLARALYKNKDILILDEATNSLDVYNESVIFDKIINLYSDKTIVVSTHNINLVKNFDCIFFISKGAIAEFGSHQELLDKKGLYSIFYKIQNKL